jgi:group I intron endonuclease
MAITTRWLIYKITCVISHKSYIGITKTSIGQRWMRHRNTAKRGSPIAMSRAIRKYGASAFVLELIATEDTFEDAAAAERFFIEDHRTLWPNGYNLTTGGEATMGRRVSDEARARMSASAKARGGHPLSAEARAKMSASRRAIMTPELREKIGAAHRGKIMSSETREKLRQAALAQWARLRAG